MEAAVSLAAWIAQGAITRRACDTRRDELRSMTGIDVSALLP
jgi:hypothetical protein